MKHTQNIFKYWKFWMRGSAIANYWDNHTTVEGLHVYGHYATFWYVLNSEWYKMNGKRYAFTGCDEPYVQSLWIL
jgi:hypothetical protein